MAILRTGLGLFKYLTANRTMPHSYPKNVGFALLIIILVYLIYFFLITLIYIIKLNLYYFNLCIQYIRT